ncbi:MAG: 2-hydroxyacid dehydrogenase [Phycisphaerae bacterium]
MARHDLQDKSVLVTRPIPDSGITRLAAAGLAVELTWKADGLTPDQLRQRVARHDAVLCQLTDRIDRSVLSAAAPRCRIFANCAAGVDNIDRTAAAALSIAVTNTPGVLTETTADLTWGLLLATARRLGEAERSLRTGAWRGWRMLDFLGGDVHGKTLGLIGAGRIATAVARRAAGFGMRLLYHARRPAPAIETAGAAKTPLPQLLAASDFVSLHVPLTDDTRHMIDADALARMRPDAILINTARGAVVDERALIEALHAGRLGGAGLDVYAHEPRVPAELCKLSNVVLLPHIGSATLAARSRMADIAASNVIAVVGGNAPLNPVI